MRAPDDQRASVVREWVAAIHLLKLRASAPTDIVGFHAQQCVEKYLQALLVWHGLGFPKMHNLVRLFELLPAGFHPEMTPAERMRLTDFATATRYPGDSEPITLAEARRAVALARRVRREWRRWLPRAALKR